MAIIGDDAKRRQGLAVGVGLGGVAVLSIALAVVDQRYAYNAWMAFALVPVLIVISLPALFRQAAREADRRLVWVFVGALVLKLAGAMGRYIVAFGAYGGQADARAYWNAGLVIGPQLRHAVFTNVHLFGLSGTNFIRSLSGLTVAAVGPSLLGGFLIFSWIGFWGMFLLYRSFTIALPNADRRWYAGLVFFLPSMMFWPSSVGKEAWMVLGIGLTAFGLARMLTGRTLNGLLWMFLGLGASALVRPPIAGMLAIAVVFGIIARPATGRLGALAKVAVLIPVLVVTALLLHRAESFLRSSGISTTGGVSSVLRQTTSRTQEGGSKFAPSVLSSPWRAPIAAFTVLFRPYLLDVRDIQTAFAALEGTFLVGLCIVRYRWIGAALRSLRRQPYLVFALTYTLMFVAAFSSIANFGILVRERVQVLPLFVVLLCVPPSRPGRRTVRQVLDG